jgi:hypothetical protein
MMRVKITVDNRVAKSISTRDARKVALRVMRDRDLTGHLLLVLRKTKKSYTRASVVRGVSEEDSNRLKKKLSTSRPGNPLPNWTLTIRVPPDKALLPYHVTRHVAWFAVWAAGQKRRTHDVALMRRLASVGGGASAFGAAELPKQRTNRREFESAITAVTRRVCAALGLPTPPGATKLAATSNIVSFSADVPLSNATWNGTVDSFVVNDDMVVVNLTDLVVTKEPT